MVEDQVTRGLVFDHGLNEESTGSTHLWLQHALGCHNMNPFSFAPTLHCSIALLAVVAAAGATHANLLMTGVAEPCTTQPVTGSGTVVLLASWVPAGSGHATDLPSPKTE